MRVGGKADGQPTTDNGQPLFRSRPGFASFSPFFFPAQSVISSEIAAQRLRKKSSTISCAKDEEKARKICGLACGFAARKRWRSGGKAWENESRNCGTKSLQLRILKLDPVFFLDDDFTLFCPPLDRGFYEA